MNIKNIVNKLALFTLSNFLLLTIMLFVVFGALSNRSTLKQWLSEANTYQGFTENFLSLIQRDEAEGRTLKQELEASPLDAGVVERSITDVYTPDYLQKKTELLIDGGYDVLEGESDTLDVVINFGEKAPQLQKSLTTALKGELVKLPECRPENTPPEFDVFSATCLPAGANVAAVASSIAGDIAGGDGAVDALTINGPELVSNDAAQNASGLYQQVETAYRILPWALLLLVVIVFLTGRSWRRSVFSVSKVVFWPSLTALISFILLSRVSQVDSLGITNEVAKALIRPLIDVVTSDIAARGIPVAATLMSTSALVWLTIFFIHRQHAKESTHGKMLTDDQI